MPTAAYAMLMVFVLRNSGYRYADIAEAQKWRSTMGHR